MASIQVASSEVASLDRPQRIMTKEDGGWHHCGRCGSFFRADVGASCPECAQSPVVTESELAFLRASNEAKEKAKKRAEEGRPRRRSKSSRKSRKSGVWIFAIFWVLFLGALAMYVRSIREGDNQDGDWNAIAATDRNRELGESMQQCELLLRQFLADSSDESRAQLALDPQTTLLHMVRFSGDMLRATEQSEMQWVSIRTVETPVGELIEGVVTLSDGKRVECVFIKNEKGEWAIDWDQMVRYSSLEWRRFLDGDTAETGEFRLLARKRRSNMDGTSGSLSASGIQLLEPSAWKPGDVTNASPKITVDETSAEAKILNEGFALMEDNDAPYGSILHKDDPVSMMRVRVILRRDAQDPEKITIEKVLACHWKSIDDTGVDFEEQEKAE